jgi:hypothetical protein
MPSKQTGFCTLISILMSHLGLEISIAFKRSLYYNLRHTILSIYSTNLVYYQGAEVIMEHIESQGKSLRAIMSSKLAHNIG